MKIQIKKVIRSHSDLTFGHKIYGFFFCFSKITLFFKKILKYVDRYNIIGITTYMWRKNKLMLREKMTKITTILLIMALCFQQTLHVVSADSSVHNIAETTNEYYLFAEKPEGSIPVFEDENNTELLYSVPDGSFVQLLEWDDDYSLIRFSDSNETNDEEENQTVITGYVNTFHIVENSDVELFLEVRNEEDFDLKKYYEEYIRIKDSENNQLEVANADQQTGPALNHEQAINDEASISVDVQNDSLLESESNSTDDDDGHEDVVDTTEVVQYRGFALASQTNVFTEPEKDSDVLKSYRQGHLLKFQSFDSEWHSATVYINGIKHTGYIDANDVEIIDEGQRLEGIAFKHPVSVYSNTSRDSDVLKEYKFGHRLIYRYYSNQWYEATVYVNGQAKTGYIHVSDVGQKNISPSVSGIALKQTHIYSDTNKSSIIKSYNEGHILKYRGHDSNWYKATVYVNGKAREGFIDAKDVETSVTSQTSLRGVALNNPTRVFSAASTSSRTLKSYQYGHILQYRTFTSNWYEATVYVNGKAQKGYIHKTHVGDMNSRLKGYANVDQLRVFSNTSRSSSTLKSYKKGSLLQYRAYNSNWFVATVYINGKAHTGYIHKNDVSVNPPIEKGYALINPTAVYKSTSKKSARLKTYRQGQLLQYRMHNDSWYVATVYINGKAQTGYIHVNDVGTASELAALRTIVNPRQVYSYNQMVSDIKQLQRAYPDLIQYKVVGKTEYGRDIYAISLGNGKATAFINGSHHAREWLTTNLNMHMIEDYAKAYINNSRIQGFSARSILNSTTLWFIPMVNPDGVILQQEGLKAYPKSMHASLIRMNQGSLNFKRWKANIKGIDLNRQYDADWATIKHSPKAPNYQFYKGTAPATASEVKAVLKLVDEINPEIAVAYHSSGEILYWNYKQNRADYNRDHVIAKAIGKMTGYSLVYPGPNPSGGGFTDWFIQKKKRPGFTPEISRYVFETNPPLSEYNRAWQKNRAVGLYVAQESAKLYRARAK